MEKTTKKEVKKSEKELDKAVEEVKDIIVVPETPMVPHDFKTKLTRKQIEVIKEQFAKGASDTELQLFLYVCQRTGLDPFSRQIHLMPRWNSKIGKDIMMVVIGIDGLRSTAERTGAYAGNTDPVFGEDMEISVTKKGYNGSKDTVTKYTVPSRATVTVKKVVHGLVCDFPATAKWTEYYPGDKGGMMWIKMPENMLGKCAEAKALRKAFPSVMSGLYVPEEMQQAIVVAGDETPKKPEERNYDKASRMIALIMNIPELKDIIGKIQGSTKYTDDQKVKLTAMIDKRIQELTPPPVEPKVEGEEAIEELESGI